MTERVKIFWNFSVSASRIFNRNTSCRVTGRRFKSTASVNKIPLNEAIPNLPKPVYATVSQRKHETKVTTLENGLRVASEHRFGEFCTLGVVIDSGARYEVSYPSGITHFLEKLAFNSTKEYKDRDHIFQELERHGAICDCQGSRDTLIYAASAYTSSLDKIMHLMSDAVLRPLLTEEEISMARMAIQYELEDINRRPDQDPILLEMIHAVSYRENTLGLPKLCPPENVNRITRNHLYHYMKSHHIPSRMVVAGVGVDHDALVEVANRYFVEKQSIWEEDTSLGVPGKPLTVDKSISQFTGGLLKVDKDLSNVSLGPTPMPELAHVAIALESCSHQHKDFIPFCVLNTLMGGGGSFSAGGPGKGMYTRLYTNVLNRYPWMNSCTAYNHAWGDSGIFCIQGSSHPVQLDDLVKIIVRELLETTGTIGEQELERAKIQLESMLLMNLESRPIVFEDIGRQVLATGYRNQPEYYIERIREVTAKDIYRICNNMLKCRPSVAALGELKRLPSLKDIELGLLNKTGNFPKKKRFSLFR